MGHIVDVVIDYLHIARGYSRAFIYKDPPKDFLSDTTSGKLPIILIPGVASTWTFLKPLADKVSQLGHPVYIVPALGYNFSEVSKAAQLVWEIINKNNLHNVIILAHSKGGLIGKDMLIDDNKGRINKLITIATPFNGSNLANLLPNKSELRPNSELINRLNSNTEVNHKIISIYPEFDNLIISNKGSYLKGAKNIKLKVKGHTKILNTKELQEEILKYLD